MKILSLIWVVGCLLLTSGCASIASSKYHPAIFNSKPPGAMVTIVNESGRTVYQGKTPFRVILSASDGYFDSMDYTARFEYPCYKTESIALETSVNPWYFGNVILGGPVGFLFIDPATGAMFTLKDYYYIVMGRLAYDVCRDRADAARRGT